MAPRPRVYHLSKAWSHNPTKPSLLVNVVWQCQIEECYVEAIVFWCYVVDVFCFRQYF